MTELELLQQKHREDAAARREQFKERKRRAHRLIERGAMLESAIKDICPPESLTDKQMEQIIYFAIQNPETIAFIIEKGKSLLIFRKKGALITDPGGTVCGPSDNRQEPEIQALIDENGNSSHSLSAYFHI